LDLFEVEKVERMTELLNQTNLNKVTNDKQSKKLSDKPLHVEKTNYLSFCNLKCNSLRFIPHHIAIEDEPNIQILNGAEKGKIHSFIKSTVCFNDRQVSQENREPFWCDEYECSFLKHGDRALHRFVKRLSLFPGQCFRYDVFGDPLLCSPIRVLANKSKPVIPKCPHCQEERIFELQLLPNIFENITIKESDFNSCGAPYVSKLSPSDVDWITVLVYTCANTRGCGNGSYCEEFVYIELDPDVTLIKSNLYGS
jgi:hypothetical protein